MFVNGFLLKGQFCFHLVQQLTFLADTDASCVSLSFLSSRVKLVFDPFGFEESVGVHKHYGSRFLIDSLHSHGFCSSYSEVQKFERSAALFQGTDIPELNDADESVFIQHSADNVDHKIRTNTFHGMGIIVAVTPKLNRKFIILASEKYHL